MWWWWYWANGVQHKRELLKQLLLGLTGWIILLGLTGWIILMPNNSDWAQSLKDFQIDQKKSVHHKRYRHDFSNAFDIIMIRATMKRVMMLTMRQGLWTNLMDPRQRHGESRGFEGSTLGSWQILERRNIFVFVCYCQQMSTFFQVCPWGLIGEFFGRGLVCGGYRQSCEMSILLHGAKSLN